MVQFSTPHCSLCSTRNSTVSELICSEPEFTVSRLPAAPNYRTIPNAERLGLRWRLSRGTERTGSSATSLRQVCLTNIHDLLVRFFIFPFVVPSSHLKAFALVHMVIPPYFSLCLSSPPRPLSSSLPLSLLRACALLMIHSVSQHLRRSNPVVERTADAGDPIFFSLRAILTNWLFVLQPTGEHDKTSSGG